eukprot:2477074-Pyramimonas_sp.AAC.1
MLYKLSRATDCSGGESLWPSSTSIQVAPGRMVPHTVSVCMYTGTQALIVPQLCPTTVDKCVHHFGAFLELSGALRRFSGGSLLRFGPRFWCFRNQKIARTTARPHNCPSSFRRKLFGCRFLGEIWTNMGV